MAHLKRKLKRDKEKEARKELTKKVGLFNKLPNHCLTCNEKFDKTNKEMVMAWNVVVRQNKETVRLYCPSCWDKARQLVEEIKSGFTNSKNDV